MSDEEWLQTSELHRIADQRELEKAREALARVRIDEEHQAALRWQFMERRFGPDDGHRLANDVRKAAEQGQKQFRVLTFSSTYCSDHGRAINSGEPDWPKSLTGFAASTYEFFLQELAPKGYKLRAEIITFPEGSLGDVGMYLEW
ncbi:MAG: hypothetical protein U1E45_24630 [Geminicoccaceae bacterium]